jgi:hypothetical protein
MLKLVTIALFSALALTSPAQAAPKKPKAAPAATSSLPATPLDLRIEQLVPLLNDKLPLESYFTPSFLTAIPPAQFKEITGSFTQQHGAALKIASVKRNGPNNAVVSVVRTFGTDGCVN